LRVKMEAAHYTKLHRVTIQKSSTWNFKAVKTSNL
jgi:hypothetical protein